MKNPEKVKQGKKNRQSGAAFELRVRKDLEEKGWIVDKWSNNVDLGDCYGPCLIPAKNKFNPFSKAMMLGGGFPDCIALKPCGKAVNVDFDSVIENNINTLRYSLDGTKTFVKFEGDTPSFLIGEPQYNHTDILNILSGPEWAGDEPF